MTAAMTLLTTTGRGWLRAVTPAYMARKAMYQHSTKPTTPLSGRTSENTNQTRARIPPTIRRPRRHLPRPRAEVGSARPSRAGGCPRPGGRRGRLPTAVVSTVGRAAVSRHRTRLNLGSRAAAAAGDEDGGDGVDAEGHGRKRTSPAVSSAASWALVDSPKSLAIRAEMVLVPFWRIWK